jgi:2-methylisocitrate lyase-like PEP mutase family enzyme
MTRTSGAIVSGEDGLREKAERLRRLHHGPPILVLPNAWDVASARLFARAGFPAIGTTSAGIAATLGYPDGEQVDPDEMLEVVGRIARGVPGVPVTADVEAGYGDGPDAIARTVRHVLAAGAVGINLEDTRTTPDGATALRDVAGQVERIRAAREAAAEAGVPLVVNARTDVFLLPPGEGEPDGERRLAEAVARSRAYLASGADCAFVPGLRDADRIAALVRDVAGPVNILAGPGVPDAGDLERLGVARVSVGSGPYRATLALVETVAAEFRDRGAYGAFTDRAVPYAALRDILDRDGAP